MKKFLFLLGLLLSAIFIFYCISSHASQIQSDIQARASTALEQNNLADDVKLSVSGRDIILTGTVKNEELRTQAARVASSTKGMRLIDNRIKIAKPSPLPPPIGEPEAEMSSQSESPEPVFEVPMPAVPMAEPEPVAIPEPEPEFVPEPEVIAEPEPVQEPEMREQPEVVPEPEMIKEPEIIAEPEVILEPEIIVEQEVIIEPEPLTAQACESKLEEMLKNKRINFDSSKATIKPDSYDFLNTIVVEIKKCENSVLEVHGHTDSSGRNEANRQLSLQRAKAVGQYIANKGIIREITAHGYGSSKPVAGNETPEGRAQNRRIEFKLRSKNGEN